MSTVTVEPGAPQVRPQDIPTRRRREGVFRGAGPRALGLVLVLAVLGALVIVSIAVGSKPVSIWTVFDAFLDYDRTLDDHLIIRSLRLPRTEVGLLVGVALGLAGAVMQGAVRNPLADPGILGIEAGAAFMVVIGIYVFGVASLLGYVWFAFAGAAGAAIAVYGIGSLGREGATPIKLCLAGAAIATLLGSLSSAILLLDVATLDQFRFWAVGSLAGRSSEIALQLAPFILTGTVLALMCGPALNALALGDDMAKGLGQRVGRARGQCAFRRPALWRRHGSGGADRVRRPGGAARRAADHGARLPLDPAVLDGARTDPAARSGHPGARRDPPGGAAGRDRHGRDRGAVLRLARAATQPRGALAGCPSPRSARSRS
jgi:iron complex transport system permease protein